MAIDRLKKVWLVSPAADAEAIPPRLAEIGLLHVSEVAPEGSEPAAAVSRLAADTRDLEARIRKLNETLDVLKAYSKSARDLLSNLIPTPIETTQAELEAALAAVDVEGLHHQVKDAAARRATAQAVAQEADEQLASLAAFGSFRVPMPAEGALRWTRAGLWLVSAKEARRVFDRGLLPQAVTLQPLGTVGGATLAASVCLSEDEAETASRLRDLGFEPVPPPQATTTLDAHVAAIEATRLKNVNAAQAAKAELKELARLRPQVELVLGHWEEKREIALAQGKMAQTGRAAVLLGYVRAREADRFAAIVARDLPQVAVVMEEPGREDRVPVSLSNSRLVRPAQFLVEMFGLPSYRAFDPSAFLMLSFVVFYGFCLGDTLYGLVQIGIAAALMRRYRAYPGLRNFFSLLAWGGISATIVGVLTGTWASDLWSPRFLGEGNVFERLVTALRVGDPLEKPLVVLGIALVMGVLNQLWGVTMKFHGYWRLGDRRSAIFDAGFWYLVLPGLVMLVTWFFSAAKPAWLLNVGGGLAAVGALGLILTQGRHETSLPAKAIVGLVSLYGIVGSYGCVAFVGDTLSYSRLLALGLTTTIVGMAVNIIASIVNEMLGSGLILGIIVFVVLAVPGHFFNLLISGLGAFIHSARLIFVEFFGRFYEPGAQRFAPLGATGGRIRVMD